MGLGSAFKSIGKAVSKPFKEVGKAIHWTDIRYQAIGAAVGAATGGIGGALVGALAGNQVAGQQTQKKIMEAEQVAAAAAAQQQYNASLQPAATPASTINPAVAEESYSADRKRRFSLSRTTMQRASLLGGSGTGRTTLG